MHVKLTLESTTIDGRLTIAPAALATLAKLLARPTLASLIGEGVIAAHALPEPVAPVKLLKIPEVASALRLSRGHAYELIKRGDLEAVRVGKTVAVRQTTLDLYIAQHEARS